MIDISNNFFHLFHNDDFLNHSVYFNNFFSITFNFDNLFYFPFDLFNLFNDHGDFYNFFDNLLNVIVNSNELWDDSFDFNKFRNLNHDLSESLHFIDLRNSYNFLNDFLDNLLSSNNLLHS